MAVLGCRGAIWVGDVIMAFCVMCGEPVSKPNRGPTRKTCSARCRMALSRRRQLHQFPPVMVAADRWVRADGKRPIMPDGSPASSTNPATWSPFSAVRVGVGDGFGFMCGGGVGCYDLDHALDGGVLKSWARDAVESIPEPVLYVERSVSGEGLHVFVEAVEGRGSRRQVGDGRVERYTRARFIRCGEPFNLM